MKPFFLVGMKGRGDGLVVFLQSSLYLFLSYLVEMDCS